MRKSFIFVLAAAAMLLMAPARNAQAQSKSETPKIEIGAQYTLLQINGFGPNDATDSGVGGRITYNINRRIGVEGEYNFFPEGRINFANPTSVLNSDRTQGLFGAKYAIVRTGRAAIFAKARPGFVRFSQGTPAAGTASSQVQFALDYGGVVELYPARAFALRFDVGDTVIRYDNPVFVTPFFTHNLQISTGVALRF
ncbi:MAG: porin family protein [Chloracidobacterium sp.]|nr:porin family protein [Chloracidobacterium sp.]